MVAIRVRKAAGFRGLWTSVTINAPTSVKARVLSAASVWSPMTEAFFDTGTVPSLLVTEVMYHPPDNGAVDGDQYEFIEIKNTGAQTVNLFGMKFTAGITYDFPEGATIAAGQFKVIARNAAQFAAKYPAVPLPGAWGAGSSLSNGGDTLTLSDAANRTVFSVTWLDSAPWPITPDGSGPSLVPVNANAIPAPNNANNWRASTNPGGSPGADDPAPPTPPVLINEVLANSATGDRIELFNPNAAAVDVGDWWLSDDIATPKKYRIATGTVIASGGFLVFAESDFNLGAIPFSFSSNGDEAVLSSGDVTGALTGYAHVVHFGASESGVSFGRHLNSQNAEFFTAQKTQTFGGANAGPKIGPVVISEMMIEPLAGNDEFVELRNIGSAPVPLFDPANPSNTWKVEGIGYNLPAGLTLQPRQVILLSPIAPATFAAKYSVPAAVAIYGPFTGALNNGGERVAVAAIHARANRRRELRRVRRGPRRRRPHQLLGMGSGPQSAGRRRIGRDRHHARTGRRHRPVSHHPLPPQSRRRDAATFRRHRRDSRHLESRRLGRSGRTREQRRRHRNHHAPRHATEHRPRPAFYPAPRDRELIRFLPTDCWKERASAPAEAGTPNEPPKGGTPNGARLEFRL